MVFAAQTLLAQTVPSYTPPPAFDSWLSSAFYAVGLLTAVVMLVKNIFPKRTPPLEAEFVSKTELEKFCLARHQPVAEILQNIQHDLRAVEAKRELYERMHSERADAIHGRVSRLVPVIYTIAGRMKIHIPQE